MLDDLKNREVWRGIHLQNWEPAQRALIPMTIVITYIHHHLKVENAVVFDRSIQLQHTFTILPVNINTREMKDARADLPEQTEGQDF